MTRIIMMKQDDATKALKHYHDAFDGGPCKACKGSCCQGCAEGKGYLRRQEYIHNRRKYGWDKVKGFQTEQGCRIPVEERSETCVGFQCDGLPIQRFSHATEWSYDAQVGPMWQFSDKQRQARYELTGLLNQR